MKNSAAMTTRSCLRFDGNGFASATAEVAAEFALTVFVNDREFATIACSPDGLEELIIGFLASEGVIRRYEEIQSLMIDSDKGFAYVNLIQRSPIDPALFSKRRFSSCCGKGRQSYYFASDAVNVQTVKNNFSIRPDQCIAYMSELAARSFTHRLTGGVHNASLCDQDGVVMFYSDIGRHNAMDKIYGACLRGQVSTMDKPLAISGRLSSEMVLKAAKIGSPVLLSKSAPTDLAIQLANELGIALVGFIRGNAFNVYTHPGRIEGME